MWLNNMTDLSKLNPTTDIKKENADIQVKLFDACSLKTEPDDRVRIFPLPEFEKCDYQEQVHNPRLTKAELVVNKYIDKFTNNIDRTNITGNVYESYETETRAITFVNCNNMNNSLLNEIKEEDDSNDEHFAINLPLEVELHDYKDTDDTQDLINLETCDSNDNEKANIADKKLDFTEKDKKIQQSQNEGSSVKKRRGESNKQYVCNICNKIFKYKKYYTKHKRTHDQNKLLCQFCSQGYENRNDLEAHVNEAHKIENPADICTVVSNSECTQIIEELICSICGKQLKTKYRLKEHIQTHALVKPFGCDICPKRYNRKDTLNEHMRIHSGAPRPPQRTFQCDICNKILYYRSRKMHLRMHNEERPFQCEICGHKCRQNSALVRHRRVHTGEKPYECSICNKKFRASSSLRSHESVHSGISRIQCSVCNKAFNHKGDFNKHFRKHTGERPFMCDICPKAFPVKSSLKMHQLTHTNEKLFKCSFCTRGFNKSARLKKHLTTHTQAEVENA